MSIGENDKKRRPRRILSVENLSRLSFASEKDPNQVLQEIGRSSQAYPKDHEKQQPAKALPHGISEHG